MNAKLNLALRERHGLVYAVESMTANYSDTGLWSVYFGCDPQDVEKCCRLVRKELNNIKRKAMSPSQLKAAQQQIKGQIGVACDNRLQFALDFGKDYLLYVKLSKTEPKLYGENAYVIVDSNYTKEKLEELTSDPLYKKIRSDIITVIPGTRKVYVATPKMFNNVLAKNTPAEPKFEQAGPKSALEDYLNRAEQLGIDIHFGDD